MTQPAESPDPGALLEAVRSGDRRASLEALRDWLTKCMVAASLSARPLYVVQLLNVIREIDELPSAETTRTDELDASRAARRARTDARVRAKREGGKAGGSRG